MRRKRLIQPTFGNGCRHDKTRKRRIRHRAPIVTRGYESSKRDVRIEGTGILGGMNYRVSEGPLPVSYTH